MWHVCLEGLKDVGSLCYGWRAEANVAWEGRSRFHPGEMFAHLHRLMTARSPQNRKRLCQALLCELQSCGE